MNVASFFNLNLPGNFLYSIFLKIMMRLMQGKLSKLFSNVQTKKIYMKTQLPKLPQGLYILK